MERKKLTYNRHILSLESPNAGSLIPAGNVQLSLAIHDLTWMHTSILNCECWYNKTLFRRISISETGLFDTTNLKHTALWMSPSQVMHIQYMKAKGRSVLYRRHWWSHMKTRRIKSMRYKWTVAWYCDILLMLELFFLDWPTDWLTDCLPAWKPVFQSVLLELTYCAIRTETKLLIFFLKNKTSPNLAQFHLLRLRDKVERAIPWQTVTGDIIFLSHITPNMSISQVSCGWPV